MRNISFGLKKFRKATFVLAALSFLIVNVSKAQDVVEGRTLFKSKCASCHALDHDGTGPALTPKVNELEESFLIPWIRNNVELRASGNKQAIEAAKFSPSEMTAFPNLTDDQIKNIIAYAKAGEPKKEVAAGAGAVKDEGVSGLSIAGVIAIIVLSIVVLVVLGRAVKMLERLILEKQGIEVVEDDNVSLATGLKGLFKNKKFVFFSVLCLVIVLGSFGWMGMWETGVHTGYQPTQPIKFSHELHAGINQIDCQYCHTGAFKSKNSTIPSLNVCMNCHKNISEVAETTATEEHSKAFYDGEIAKLYDAVGWDKSLQKYTGKTKPVKWVRIHNLPDHVYFNHSQHVTVAGVECQTCHGPVEEMEIMKQHAPLTMGWCINCHRETNVKVEDNAYYKKIHEELSKKYGVSQLTAAQMGGLECGKCHY